MECYSIEDKIEFLVSQYYKYNDSILFLPTLQAQESCVASGYYVYIKTSHTFLNTINVLVFSNRRTKFYTFKIYHLQHAPQLKKRTNQQNAQINFGLINLLLFNHSNMFRPLNRSHHQGVQNP